MGGESGMLSGTLRELRAEFEGSRRKRVRQDGDEVLCAERAAIFSIMNRPSQALVVDTLTAAGDAEGRSHGLRGRTDHALGCRNMSAESEESPKRREAVRCRRGRSQIGKAGVPSR